MRSFVGGADQAGLFLFGATLWIGFLFFSGCGLLALYLFVEGLVRGLAVAVTFEPCGSLLVLLLDRLARLRPRRKLPKVPDAVTRQGADVLIATCRVRDWDVMTTVELEGEHYLVGHHHAAGAPPRPHTYRLVPLPPGRAIRKLVRYPD
jgi:hypothetical protein